MLQAHYRSPRHRWITSALVALLLPSAALAEPATPATTAANAQVLKRFAFDDQRDFDNAHRGFIATLPDARVTSDDGRLVWTQQDYRFLDAPAAPASVNPALWRHAQLNRVHGLFKVCDHLYQVRGFDLANLTFVEADDGLIVIDTGTSVETARAALALYYAHRPHLPIVAIIYTHSHADHFGGVKGLVDERDVAAGKITVIAPAHFMEEAVSENVIAGPAMRRRAVFQFGNLLAPGPQSAVDAGLGKARLGGVTSLIAPTDSITQPLEQRSIHGVNVEFMLTPNTEAPAEMFLYFPQFKALDLAENATHTLHNLLPLRGAQVRDANGWAKALDAALARYGARSEVVLAQHHWPTWGNAELITYMSRQRDLYKYVHDQSVRLMNFGHTPDEIAEQLRLPSTLAQEWSAHGLYGTLSHDAKAVYQRYLGWYDGNPAHLNPLPPVERARKLVQYMGGSAAVLAKARADYDAGQYRWVAQIVNEVIFAEPDNREARQLQARALEQLGYQAESATWRNAYLQAAAELRNGAPKAGRIVAPPDIVSALSVEQVFDTLAVRVDGDKADGKKIRIRWRFSDTGQTYVLNLENAALTSRSGDTDSPVDADLTLSRKTLNAIITGQSSFPKAFLTGDIHIQGSKLRLLELFATFDDVPDSFAVVTPEE